ncbi:MAG TPA: choice-of-anchor I family protein [Chitinophagaceae bacterium]|nr:choice-of-anchor I family protein [Chitinophagaceae bacterium]
MNYKFTVVLVLLFGTLACTKIGIDELKTALGKNDVKEDPSNFELIGSIDIGTTGAAEISAYDPKTKRLFVVDNSTVNQIDVLDLSNPGVPLLIANIDVQPYGGLVNSVAVNDGKLAAAIEAVNKQENGKVVVFDTKTYSKVAIINVGALPDMITFSPDGKFILTANEGEPNTTYTVDPLGSVSIISVKNDYAVSTINFSSFGSQQALLQSKGLRVFGPNASFGQDMEPEYITISDDSRTAWVTLQENNAIAKIDLSSKAITNIFPLGFKNYNGPGNAIDATDRPLGTVAFNNAPVYGMYQPDAIAVLMDNNKPYLFTANEGDAREYNSFAEEARIGSLPLDPVAFPNGAALKAVTDLGRLNVTKTLGDPDADGDYDALYSLGARSFSVWNGLTGDLLYDSKNELEIKANGISAYDDDRSDNKGVEPEGIALGTVNKKHLVFVGMERADAIAIYDVSNPLQPRFLQILKTGDAPEGVLFISQQDSPTKRSLLVISSENDGFVNIYAPVKL